MNKFIKTTIFTLLVASIFFTGCGIKDNKPPRIYLVGSKDTIVIMREKYVDPGFYAEDNVSKTENIILSSNIEDVMGKHRTSDGYTNRNELYEVTYTATDEAGNSRSINRNISVQNISTPYAGSYTCYRRHSNFWGDTTYRSSISVDNRVAGRLKINKIYNHYDPQYHSIMYFKINADLWAPDLCRSVPHFDNTNNNSGVGYQGISNTNNSVPWYRGMSYEEATTTRRFEYIIIPEMTYEDSVNQISFRILGSNQADGTPMSRIEYISGEISKIILKYNISKVGTTIVDQVTEEYTPIE